MRSSIAIFIGTFLLAMPAAVWSLPAGSEFQVNTYTTDKQFIPSVAVDAEGDFVVVWTGSGSSGSDSSDYSVQGQRYASDGSPRGGEFQVNTYTTGDQARGYHGADVGMDSDGDFVVVWDSQGSSGSDSYRWSVQGQRYASDGSPRGDEFQVNTYTSIYQWNPSVAMEADGDFVVIWTSYGSSGTDSDRWSVQGQRYASDGSPRGGEFQVNTYTTNYQGEYSRPNVAMDSSGDFVVVWQSGKSNASGSSGTDLDGWSVQGRRYASDGSAVGSEFQVNTYTTDNQQHPSVAMDADGDFVVVWHSDDESVLGQRYASDGSLRGAEFQVNTYATYGQYFPRVAMDSDGDFVVVWQDNVGCCVQSQRYSSDGSPVGDEFKVNTYRTESNPHPDVGINPAGDFVVVWFSHDSHRPPGGSDSSEYSIRGQRFCDDGDGDGKCDSHDTCPGFDDNVDLDGDQVPDGCDTCPGFDDNVDVDGDQVPDGCDTCVGGAPGQADMIDSRLSVANINTDSVVGNDKLKIKGAFTLPGGTTLADLNPATDGALIVLAADGGSALIDTSIAAGVYDGTAGWYMNGAQTAWAFKDRRRPAGSNGISKVKLKDRREKVKVSIKGKDGDYQVTAADLPLQLTLDFGDETAGECTEKAFSLGECRFNGPGNKLSCR